MADKFISANAIYDELSDIFIEFLATTSDKNTKAALESLYSTVLKAVDAADAIEELLAAVPKWISVEERLPKTRPSILGQKSSKVIVAFQFDDGMQGTDTAHILNGDWAFEDRITVVNRTVTHWMPLPAPPKEDAE